VSTSRLSVSRGSVKCSSFTMEQLRAFALKFGLMTNDCFTRLAVEHDFSHTACLKSSLSKSLGVGIVAGSSLVKLPQVLKLFASGSAEGISLMGTLLELTALTASTAYNYSQGFPFGAYGESVFLSFQTSLIALLVLWFGGNAILSVLFAAVYGGIVYALAQPGLVPDEVLWYGQAANIPMVLIGKLMQVFSNYQNGHTGQLSAITVFLLAAGALIRVFTSIQETGDMVIIATYSVSSCVNLLLAFQVLYYWNARPQSKKAKAQQKTQQKKKRQ
jgi:mannose-P-dolichol utilization defect protein 1